MTKQEFLAALREGLRGLPQSEIEERMSFYAEMIDDRVEEGVSEEDAVAAVGSIEDIVAQIVADFPFVRLVKERIKPQRRLSAWEMVLLVLGAPLWLSLLIAVAAVVLSLYVTLWSVMVALWSVFASLAGSALGCLAGGILFICTGYLPSGLATVAVALVCAGLSIFAFIGCREATKGVVWLTKKMALGIKKACVRKGEAQ